MGECTRECVEVQINHGNSILGADLVGECTRGV